MSDSARARWSIRVHGPLHAPAAVRVAGAGILGAAAWAVASLAGLSWQVAILIGWDVTALAYLAWVWIGVHTLDSARMPKHATAFNESKATANVVLVFACLGSLVGVGLDLVRASDLSGAERALTVSVALFSVALAWTVVHVVFVLRYADVFYRKGGGIDFNEEDTPDYRDFAYLAFTIGMTYQVSDTDLTSQPIRRLAIKHALLSFVFGTAIIAVTINVVAGLLNG